MPIQINSSVMKYKDTNGQYQDIIGVGANAYEKPPTGIPASDLAADAVPVQDVQVNGMSILSNGVANVPIASENNLGLVYTNAEYGTFTNANGRISVSRASSEQIKGGTHEYRVIPPLRQHESVFYGLAKAAGANMKDIASTTVGTYPDEQKGAIQSMLGVSNLIAPMEPTPIASKAYAVGDVFTANGRLYKATTAIAADGSIVLQNKGETVSGHNAEECNVAEYAVHDVQVNGASVVGADGVAEIPVATESSLGVVRADPNYGTGVYSNRLIIARAPNDFIKNGVNSYRPIVPLTQHISAFYGLAAAAGDSTQAASSNPVGTYTEAAKSAISQMLNGPVSVSGSTPAITALPGIQYICGEVATISITPPASGCCDIIFESGSTPAVLTIPSTVKWPVWFDPTTLEANATYEINILNGVYGVVGVWM